MLAAVLNRLKGLESSTRFARTSKNYARISNVMMTTISEGVRMISSISKTNLKYQRSYWPKSSRRPPKESRPVLTRC